MPDFGESEWSSPQFELWLWVFLGIILSPVYSSHRLNEAGIYRLPWRKSNENEQASFTVDEAQIALQSWHGEIDRLGDWM